MHLLARHLDRIENQGETVIQSFVRVTDLQPYAPVTSLGSPKQKHVIRYYLPKHGNTQYIHSTLMPRNQHCMFSLRAAVFGFKSPMVYFFQGRER